MRENHHTSDIIPSLAYTYLYLSIDARAHARILGFSGFHYFTNTFWLVDIVLHHP